jgi:6-phosphogluconolactonase/glucosamine-6-phosphate isomerase/deaminase
MLQFIHAGAATGSKVLGDRLTAELTAGKRVLWLISGGSNIIITVTVMQTLPEELTPKLTIAPMDERYGPPRHADSNVQQLFEPGFSPKQATFIPILNGSALEATTDAYIDKMAELLYENDVVIGQFGIGADGHTAGILPGSPAALEEAKLAIGYQAQDFSRITLTFPGLRRISAAYAFVYGTSKAAALRDLHDQSLGLDVQPAQILKALPEAYIYNNQIT